jgi:hypothetical protein
MTAKEVAEAVERVGGIRALARAVGADDKTIRRYASGERSAPREASERIRLCLQSLDGSEGAAERPCTYRDGSSIGPFGRTLTEDGSSIGGFGRTPEEVPAEPGAVDPVDADPIEGDPVGGVAPTWPVSLSRRVRARVLARLKGARPPLAVTTEARRRLLEERAR